MEDSHYKKIEFEKCDRLDFAKVGSHVFHKLLQTFVSYDYFMNNLSIVCRTLGKNSFS